MSLNAEQLEARKGKVMASDVAALLGLHPYAKPFEAWAQNLGLADVDHDDGMQMGEVLELPLICEAVKRLGWESYHQPGTVFHPAHPWAGCTPDAMRAAEMPEGMQVKVSGFHMARGYSGMPGDDASGNDNALIPGYHLLQCQWEMFVTDAYQWHLAVYFGGADFRIYSLSRDRDLIAEMQKGAYAFWRQHLDPTGPQSQPALDGSTAAGEFLRRKHPINNGNSLIPAEDLHYDLAERYQQARAAAKEYEQAANEAKHLLCEAVGDAAGIKDICTWKLTSPKPKVDWEQVSFDLHVELTRLLKETGMDAPAGLFTFAAPRTTQPEGTRTFRLTYKPQE